MRSNTQKAKLVMINAPTRSSEKSCGFYGSLLGTEFAHGLNPAVPSWWTPLGHGVDFNVTVRYDDRERLTPYFGVDDLDATIRQLEKLGGRVVVAPRDVPLGPEQAREFYVKQQKKEGHDVRIEEAKTVGRMAVILDPDLNHVGLMQIAAHAQRHFMMDQQRGELSREEVAAFSAAKRLADELESADVLPKI